MMQDDFPYFNDYSNNQLLSDGDNQSQELTEDIDNINDVSKLKRIAHEYKQIVDNYDVFALNNEKLMITQQIHFHNFKKFIFDSHLKTMFDGFSKSIDEMVDIFRENNVNVNDKVDELEEENRKLLENIRENINFNFLYKTVDGADKYIVKIISKIKDQAVKNDNSLYNTNKELDIYERFKINSKKKYLLKAVISNMEKFKNLMTQQPMYDNSSDYDNNDYNIQEDLKDNSNVYNNQNSINNDGNNLESKVLHLNIKSIKKELKNYKNTLKNRNNKDISGNSNYKQNISDSNNDECDYKAKPDFNYKNIHNSDEEKIYQYITIEQSSDYDDKKNPINLRKNIKLNYIDKKLKNDNTNKITNKNVNKNTQTKQKKGLTITEMKNLANIFAKKQKNNKNKIEISAKKDIKSKYNQILRDAIKKKLGINLNTTKKTKGKFFNK